jgi:sulfite reductase (ferredoxin)
MKSFRTELENPIVQRDILELEKKIFEFRNGRIPDEKFRSLRLARGIYGQRQSGVQMIRIKIPFGFLNAAKLRKIADVADKYSDGKLHVTTRQDIQIHFVSLDDTPELWSELEAEEVTLREACGNTVRNITASPFAGIHADEPFDVSNYADAMFRYFLRNPICADMGRKFKIAFSASEKDDAFTFIHDLGFIPVMKETSTGMQRGFRVMIGGGLGAQPHHALVAHDFLETERIIPFTEAVLRVFDRYGERVRRHKARMKFLLQDIGLEAFMELVRAEEMALPHAVFPIASEWESPKTKESDTLSPSRREVLIPSPTDVAFLRWAETSVFNQKQAGLKAIAIKLKTGDFRTAQARIIADLIQVIGSNELRLTVGQGILLRSVPEYEVPYVYAVLKELKLADPGFESVMDIVACPGTDTCNLGIASSIGLAKELERVLETNYPDLYAEKDISIKISGCMNACGQHNMANIGFQGMTVKSGALVAPASQVLLGGGVEGNGIGRFADKIIKIPAKRSPDALCRILDDYYANRQENERFNWFYDRKGFDYFYQMLKDLSATDNLVQDDFIDWGNSVNYEMAIGVGECAGVMVDMVSTLFAEAEEKVVSARADLEAGKFADSVYNSYTAMVYAAKALLSTLSVEVKLNTQAAIARSFDEHFTANGLVQEPFRNFQDLLYKINNHFPSRSFALEYVEDANQFIRNVQWFRQQQLQA